MIARIDHHMLNADNRKILVRCETNIFNLYRGAAEAELKISDDSIWMHSAKVSPTTDQRSSSSSSGSASSSSSSSTSTKNGDPDNSALQAGTGYRLNTSNFLLQLVFLLLITPALS